MQLIRFQPPLPPLQVPLSQKPTPTTSQKSILHPNICLQKKKFLTLYLTESISETPTQPARMKNLGDNHQVRAQAFLKPKER